MSTQPVQHPVKPAPIRLPSPSEAGNRPLVRFPHQDRDAAVQVRKSLAKERAREEAQENRYGKTSLGCRIFCGILAVVFLPVTLLGLVGFGIWKLVQSPRKEDVSSRLPKEDLEERKTLLQKSEAGQYDFPTLSDAELNRAALGPNPVDHVIDDDGLEDTTLLVKDANEAPDKKEASLSEKKPNINRVFFGDAYTTKGAPDADPSENSEEKHASDENNNIDEDEDLFGLQNGQTQGTDNGADAVIVSRVSIVGKVPGNRVPGAPETPIGVNEGATPTSSGEDPLYDTMLGLYDCMINNNVTTPVHNEPVHNENEENYDTGGNSYDREGSFEEFITND